MKSNILLLTICVSIILTDQVYGQSESRIVWSKTRRLTWDDFKGQPHDTSFAAATYCSIETEVCKRSFWTGKITLRVMATFFSDTSWYIKRKIHSITLRHELGHFDIAEWYSRKLRKMIKEDIISVMDYNQKFKLIYDKIYFEYYETQKQYEKETELGTNLDEQMKWEKRIESGLSLYEPYVDIDCGQK